VQRPSSPSPEAYPVPGPAPRFPRGKVEDILALSDPPYYTACPNPFLRDFLDLYGQAYDPRISYHREPFTVDVTQGKTDSLYRAHGYYTKVPHLAIVPSILHYTKPGDVVLDGFCGSGMTGLAAQWCGTAPPGYRAELEARWRAEKRREPEWGKRRVILGDLSPAATFIAANYNLPFDVDTFATAAQRFLAAVTESTGWMYETRHTDGHTRGRINYTVWSQVFTCPECTGDVVFVREALDAETRKVKKHFRCPECGVQLTKAALQPSLETRFDGVIGDSVGGIRYQPALLNYTAGRDVFEKHPDPPDLELLRKISHLPPPTHVPTTPFPFDDMWEATRLRDKGITHTHHLYLPRALHALDAAWQAAGRQNGPRLLRALLLAVQHQFVTASLMNRYRPASSFGNAPIRGTYYVSSMVAEASVLRLLDGSIRRMKRMASQNWMAFSGSSVAITTSSATDLSCLPRDSIDYIFTDPPFGDNYPYWELNFLPESWLGVFTQGALDATVDRGKVNKAKQKTIRDYQRLMTGGFREYSRVLKPGRWMTVVFSNSKNSVWWAMQEAMLDAGFVVADVRTLDKEQGSFKQVTSIAVKQDLVISAYKPNQGLEERFRLEAGTEDGVWDFVRTHLRQLPVFVARGETVEVVAERQSFRLFDRMVAFHVLRGVTMPLSAGEFYSGLVQRFPERDGMYFLPEQVAEYDRKRMTVSEVQQYELFVTDEASAILWLRQQLKEKPQTFQELHPQFMREIGGWERHERPLELLELLEENFIRYDGSGEVPSQVHAYLSSNFHDLRNLAKDDPALRAKAKDRWYVPDPRKAGDIEKVRERALLREFQEYRESTQRRLKVFRLEAVRAGFRKAWQDRDYDTIIAVARKIPETVLQEDDKLLMWYDQAVTRTGDV